MNSLRRRPVEEIILGTMTFGATTGKADALKMIQLFTGTHGFKQLDTARMYASGHTEEVLGSLFVENPELLKYPVATKANPWNGLSLSVKGVESQLKDSYKALYGDAEKITTPLDLFYLHSPDPDQEIEPCLEKVQELYEKGYFVRFGLSNFTAWEVVYIHNYMKSKNYIVPTVYQGMYNAITRQVETALLPALRKLKMSFYAYNPLAGGMLCGKYTKKAVKEDGVHEGRFNEDLAWGQAYQKRFMQDCQFDAIELIRQAVTTDKDAQGDKSSDEGGVSPTSIMTSAALQWLQSHSKLSSEYGDAIIIGASKMEHFGMNMSAFRTSKDKNGNLNEENKVLSKSLLQTYDKAWDLVKDHCPEYQRGYSNMNKGF
eukprot:g4162.t1